MKATKIILILFATAVVGAQSSWLLYHKVLQDNSDRNTCIAQLHYMAGAKDFAAQEMRLSMGAVVSTQALAQYMEGGWRGCPSGGLYNVNPIGKDPTCSVPGHALAQ